MNPLPAFETIERALDDLGYCIVPDLIGHDAAGAAREALASLEHDAPGETVRTTRNIAGRHPLLRDLVTHPFVVALWRRLLGAGMVCSSATGITLMPGHRGLNWHVDYPYWSLIPPYPTWDLAAYALWMLDDFTWENGATGIIPGSHRMTVPPDLPSGSWPSGAIAATGRKGSVLLSKGPCWHAARPNSNDGSRSAAVVGYVRSFCIPHTNPRTHFEGLDKSSARDRLLYGIEQFVPRNGEILS